MSYASRGAKVCTAAGKQHRSWNILKERCRQRASVPSTCISNGARSGTILTFSPPRFPSTTTTGRRMCPLRTRRCREVSSDRRVGSVSPRGRSMSPHQHQAEGGSFSSDRLVSVKPSVRHLVQGHSGSVTALAVFEGMHEYVTAGYDRCGCATSTAVNWARPPLVF